MAQGSGMAREREKLQRGHGRAVRTAVHCINGTIAPALSLILTRTLHLHPHLCPPL